MYISTSWRLTIDCIMETIFTLFLANYPQLLINTAVYKTRILYIIIGHARTASANEKEA